MRQSAYRGAKSYSSGRLLTSLISQMQSIPHQQDGHFIWTGLIFSSTKDFNTNVSTNMTKLNLYYPQFPYNRKHYPWKPGCIEPAIFLLGPLWPCLPSLSVSIYNHQWFCQGDGNEDGIWWPMEIPTWTMFFPQDDEASDCNFWTPPLPQIDPEDPLLSNMTVL